MIERHHRARFLLKALHTLRVFEEIIGQSLERHLTILPGVLGEIDIAHAATSQRAHDAIGSDEIAGLECKRHTHLIRSSHGLTLSGERGCYLATQVFVAGTD